MNEKELAKELLNAVWKEDLTLLSDILMQGANPSWVFNGYPILVHAVLMENEELVKVLVQAGAKQTGEALGFALEKGLGTMVLPLAYMGIVPKKMNTSKIFGEYPHRYAPLTFNKRGVMYG